MCYIEGCDINPVKNREICSKCMIKVEYYERKKKQKLKLTNKRLQNEQIDKLCSIKKCKNKYYINGFCKFHYTEKKDSFKRKIVVEIKKCIKEDCGKKKYIHELCRFHYKERKEKNFIKK